METQPNSRHSNPTKYTHLLFVWLLAACISLSFQAKNSTVFLAVLFNEGLTAPASKDYGMENAEIFQEYSPRELTSPGQRQMYELGRRIRSRYSKFLKTLPNPENYLFFSVNKTSSKASMVSFNSGFLLEDSELGFTNTAAESFPEYPVTEDTVRGVEFKSPLPENVSIFTYNRFAGFKVLKDVVFWTKLSPGECPRYKQLFPDTSEKEFDKYIEKHAIRVYDAMTEVIDSTMKFINIGIGPFNIYDTRFLSVIIEYMTFQASYNSSYPFRKGNSIYDTLQEVGDKIFWLEVGNPDKLKLSTSPFSKFLDDKIRHASLPEGVHKERQSQVLVASVGNETLSAVLYMLKFTERAASQQTYGANLVVEVYRSENPDKQSGLYVRLLLNGEELNLCNPSSAGIQDCPADSVSTLLKENYDPDWRIKCGLNKLENSDHVVIRAMNHLLTVFFISAVLVVFYVLCIFRQSKEKSKDVESDEKISLGFKISFENNANRDSDYNIDIMDNKEKAKVNLG